MGYFYARGVLTLVAEQGSTCLLHYLPVSLFSCLLKPSSWGVGGKLRGWCCNGVQNVTNDVAVWGFGKGSDFIPVAEGGS